MSVIQYLTEFWVRKSSSNLVTRNRIAELCHTKSQHTPSTAPVNQTARNNYTVSQRKEKTTD